MRVTAPGKVLLLGEYAVLDYHPALSIAVVDQNQQGVTVSISEDGFGIVSPDFGIEKDIRPDALLEALRTAAPAERLSVAAYVTALAYLQQKGIALRPVRAELANSPVFGTREEKSGLGSSAAAVTALVSAVFAAHDMDITANRDAIHKVAQVAHALATGKVGSGFDVATAAYGTIRYVRYPKEIIDLSFPALRQETFGQDIVRVVDRLWPRLRARPAAIPGYNLSVFNIRGAKTSTVSAVKAVMQLMAANREQYASFIARQVAGEREVMEGLAQEDDQRIRAGMHAAREAQRDISGAVAALGVAAFDPIEPGPLTRLIDAAEAATDVVAGRCPGAGGFDSVAFLVRKRKAATINRIVKIGREAGLSLSPLDCRIAAEGVREV